MIRDEYGQPLRATPDDGYSNSPGILYGERREQMAAGNPIMAPGFGAVHGHGQPGYPVQQVQKLEMTLEDMRMLKDCNRESFWKRCKSSKANSAQMMQFVFIRSTIHDTCKSWCSFIF